MAPRLLVSRRNDDRLWNRPVKGSTGGEHARRRRHARPRLRANDGVDWKAIGVPATSIKAGPWYHLTIVGNITVASNGSLQVHYLDFIIAGTTHSLTQYTFPPDSSTGPGLVPAVQADGNSTATPYRVYIDNAHYFWSDTDTSSPARAPK